jgi:hypothetical protein
MRSLAFIVVRWRPSIEFGCTIEFTALFYGAIFGGQFDTDRNVELLG